MLKKYSKSMVYGIIAIVTLVIGFLFVTESKKTNDYKVEAGARQDYRNCWDWHETENLGAHCHYGNNSDDGGGDGGSGEIIYEGFNNNK